MRRLIPPLLVVMVCCLCSATNTTGATITPGPTSATTPTSTQIKTSATTATTTIPTTTSPTTTTIPTTTQPPPPDHPTSVTVTPGSSSITLTVTLPTNCSGCTSVVTYSNSGHTDTETTKSQSCDQLTCPIESLTAGTCYNFTVYTHGSSGNSPTGYNTTGCTLPAPPTNVVATSHNSSITVTVTLPTNCLGCGSVLVKYSPTGNPDSETTSTRSCDPHNCPIEELSAGTCYNFTVYTQGSSGNSTTGYTTTGCTLPGPPRIVSMISGSSTITLTVTLPTKCPGCESVLVKYSPSGFPDMETTKTQSCDQPTCNVPIESLPAGTCYNFTVYTHGSSGNSSTGYTSSGCTLPAPPTNVVATSHNSSITLTVTLPTKCPGCKSVLVKYFQTDIGPTDSKITTRSCDQQTCDVPVGGVPAGTCYNFTVYTQGSSGNSTTGSNTTGCTLPAPPANVSMTSQTSSIRLTVTLPTNCPGCNSVLVKYSPSGYTDTETTTRSCDQPTCNVPIEGLPAGTCYNFKVYTQGSSNNSTTGHTTTGCTLPGPPTKVSMTPKTSSIGLTVTLPTNCPGCKSVLVKYSPSGHADTGTISPQSCNPQNCSIKGLTTGTCYNFTVYTQGSSGNSTTGYNTTGCTLPAPPAYVSMTSQTSSITLSVTLPTNCPECNSVLVEYSPFGHEDTETSTQSCNPQNCPVEGLRKGTCYSFTVYTQGSSGNSQTGYNTTGCTLPAPPANVSITSQTSSIRLSVTLPTNCPGCNSVLVKYSPSGYTDTETTTRSCDQPTCNVPVEGLPAGTCYNFKVFTQGSSGNSTTWHTTTGCTLPGPPTNVMVTLPQTSSIVLTVILPNNCPGCNSFLLKYSPSGHTDTEKASTLSCNEKLCNNYIKNLTAGTCYNFTVYTHGSSGYSMEGYNTTGCTLPSGPSDVKVSDKTTNSVTLTVTPGPGGYGGYRVKVNSGGNLRNTTYNTTDGQHSLLVRGLTSGTTFTFYVYTRANGLESTNFYSTKDSTSNKVKRSANDESTDVPSAPKEVYIYRQTNVSVMLSVTPANDGYDGFLVIHDSLNKSFPNITSEGGSFSSQVLTVDTLIPGTTYPFEVYTCYNDSTSTNYTMISGSTVPDPPDNVAVNGQTTNTVTLDITQPSSGGVDFYNITFTDWYDTTETRSTLTNETSYTVEHLTPGYSYNFTVVSVYQNLISIPYQTVQASTVPAIPERDYSYSTNNSITVILQSLDAGNVDSYFTNMDCVSSGNSINPAVSVSEQIVTINGLSPGTTCNLTLVAVFDGLNSSVAVFSGLRTGDQPPGKVEGLVAQTLSATEVSLAWKKPTEPNGEIIQYSVLVQNPAGTCVQHVRFLESANSSQDNNSCQVTREETFNTDQSNFTDIISNLSAYTRYTFSVYAYTDVGRGLESSTATNTSQAKPYKITDLREKNVSSSTISISFKEPKPVTGPITRYEVQYVYQECVCNNVLSPADNKTGYTNCTPSSGMTVCLIEKLYPYWDYNISVRAYTSKGPGNWSDPITAKTSEDKPYKITELGKDNISSSTITISFKEPEPVTGPITKYEVQYVYQERVCNNGLGQGDNKTGYTNCTPSSGRTVCLIENLYPYWDYNISVRAYTSIGSGKWSDPITAKTAEDRPSSIASSTIKPAIITAYNVTLEWSPPCPPNGVISNYVIRGIMSTPIKTSDNSVSYLVQGLLPYRKYSYQIAAETGAGIGDFAAELTFTTLTDVPRQPDNVTVPTKNATSISVTWGTPTIKTGPTNYTATATDKSSHERRSCSTTGFDKTTCIIRNLDEYWNYTVVVMATTVNGSKNSNPMDIRTAEAVPGPVTNVNVIPQNDVTLARTVNITCDKPNERDLNGIITSYTLEWKYPSSNLQQETRSNCFWSISVEAQKNYTFKVSASTSVGKGTTLSKLQLIPAGAPLIVPNNAAMIQLQSSSSVSDPEKQFRVDFDTDLVCNTQNGNIQDHYVFVSESTETSTNNVAEPFKGSLDKFRNDRLKIYQTWSAVEDADKIAPYVASKSWKPCPQDGSGKRKRRATTPQTVSFIVGEGGDCSGDCNGYVQPGRYYKVRVASCTAGGCAESQWSSVVKTEPNLVPSIAGGVVGALLAVIIILVVIFVLRRRSMLCFKGKEGGFTELSGNTNNAYRGDGTELTVVKSRKIKVSEFVEKYYQLSKDSNMKFSEEAKLIKELSPTHKTSCAEEQAVRIKNRYTNILAFDHSRVKLLPLDEEDGSDYINANYIPGYHSKREYIATQGPLVCTKDDFWRMIWEQNVSVIVMLTQLVERGRRKCDQYWPEVVSEPFYFGDLIVRIDSESTLPDYVIRVISLQLGDIQRRVKHLLYLAWPDMGTPTTSDSMIKFVESCRKHQNPSLHGPIVVHCSAGVGRTGTFIAVDHLIQRLQAGQTELDIFKMVMDMRNERPNMVQTEDQYIFIHECIKDFLSSGDDDEEDEEDEEEEDPEPIYQNA